MRQIGTIFPYPVCDVTSRCHCRHQHVEPALQHCEDCKCQLLEVRLVLCSFLILHLCLDLLDQRAVILPCNDFLVQWATKVFCGNDMNGAVGSDTERQPPRI